MSRIVSASSNSEAASGSLFGFKAVLLAIYGLEVKARAGKPVVVSIPDLSQTSLYHTPREKPVAGTGNSRLEVGIVCGPLEPQNAVKSTKRAAIVGVALDCYFKQIADMPSWSKVEFYEYVAAWAGQHCKCVGKFDDEKDELVNGFSEIRVSTECQSDEAEEDIAAERNGKQLLGENANNSFASENHLLNDGGSSRLSIAPACAEITSLNGDDSDYACKEVMCIEKMKSQVQRIISKREKLMVMPSAMDHVKCNGSLNFILLLVM